MANFKNYIFDLYGTLIDIKTDENKLSLWRTLASLYDTYGSIWEAKDLRRAYIRLDNEERDILTEKYGYIYPEIKLERVFIRLLFESPKSHPCALTINFSAINDKSAGNLLSPSGKDAFYDITIEGLRALYPENKEQVISALMESESIYAIANVFRIASRKYVYPYENTIATLKALKERGKKTYLLSNAQRIFTYPEIESAGISPYFDGIYISSDYGVKKPQPEFMARLLADNNLNPDECVMVGNEIESDIQIALSANMHSILLNTFNLSAAEIKKQLSSLFSQTNAPHSLYPSVIMSGDIGEILVSYR